MFYAIADLCIPRTDLEVPRASCNDGMRGLNDSAATTHPLLEGCCGAQPSLRTELLGTSLGVRSNPDRTLYCTVISKSSLSSEPVELAVVSFGLRVLLDVPFSVVWTSQFNVIELLNKPHI